MDITSLKFQCQGSGKCCVSRGGYGFVYLNLKDRKRMAKSLKLSLPVFTKTYCIKSDGIWHLKEDAKNFFKAQKHLQKIGNKLDVPSKWQKECIFLNQNRCMVYEGRPEQCRTWPFWPENMNAKTWKQVASFCPGVGRGPVLPTSKILSALKKQEKAEAELIS